MYIFVKANKRVFLLFLIYAVNRKIREYIVVIWRRDAVGGALCRGPAESKWPLA